MPEPNEIRAHMTTLSDDQQTEEIKDWLNKHLQNFQGLGMRPASITGGLQAELMERAVASHHKVKMGEWFANVGGLLLAAHAGGVDLKAGGQIPNHHLSLELLKYAIGRYLGEGGDQAALRDLLVSMVNDLTNVPPPKLDVN